MESVQIHTQTLILQNFIPTAMPSNVVLLLLANIPTIRPMGSDAQLALGGQRFGL